MRALLDAAIPSLIPQAKGTGSGAAGGGGGVLAALSKTPGIEYYVKTQQFIEPGVYRLQKSWERVADAASGAVSPEEVSGLLGDMGLEVKTVSSVLTPTEHTNETKPPSGGGGGARARVRTGRVSQRRAFHPSNRPCS